MIDWSGMGQFLIGVAAVGGVFVNWIINKRNEKLGGERAEKLEQRVGEVHSATNGMSERLQEFARAAGYEAGQKDQKRIDKNES